MAEEELILPKRYTRNPDGTRGVEESESNEYNITVLPSDDPKKIQLGWKITEEVGTVVINDYAISAINIDPVEEDFNPIPDIIDVDMSHLFDDMGNRFGLMEI